ncbi:hypothetical protein RASY3_03710 [Ruminococcus albus SY3]|uniref:Uncharacterized protein n=1 Tax=Ruminococcus albus SY3 TaxID=1341156 RepID=A0A011W0I9_RUMAL|nr:hypothetical protein [Ruminococcus albus]EXM41071.1 hypothetical protein RASY3_03710 [Ruminococcus albus SY3]
MTFKVFLEDVNTEKYIYLDKLEETENGLVIDIMGTTASALNEQDIASTAEEFGEDVAELVKNSSSIDPNEHRRWRLVFGNYISYAVINESYDNGDRGTRDDHNCVCTATDSDWLDYVKASTFAHQIFDDIKHYQICCLDHIINVAADEPPFIDSIQLN